MMALCLIACGMLVSGCSRFRPQAAKEYVYVTAKQQTLRDRVAAVSNRTGTVQNGDRLKVLEHGRRFLRVQTEKGEMGWIEERTVVGQDVYDAFAALAKQHAQDPAVATGVVRDEVYVHLTPGRATEKFFRLAEGDKLSLIERATLPKGGGLKAGPLKNPRQAAIPGAATGIAPAKASSAAMSAKSAAGGGEQGDSGEGALRSRLRRRRSRMKRRGRWRGGTCAAGDGGLVAGAGCAGPRRLDAHPHDGRGCAGFADALRGGAADRGSLCAGDGE